MLQVLSHNVRLRGGLVCVESLKLSLKKQLAVSHSSAVFIEKPSDAVVFRVDI